MIAFMIVFLALAMLAMGMYRRQRRLGLYDRMLTIRETMTEIRKDQVETERIWEELRR